MNLIKKSMVGLSMVLLAGMGLAFAGSDLNEVGAFLVFPIIEVDNGGAPDKETIVTLTNTGAEGVYAHISFINGEGYDRHDPDPDYCKECDFSIFLTPNDTTSLVFTPNSSGGTDIVGEDEGELQDENGIFHPQYFSRSCAWRKGFLTVNVENPEGETVTSNILLGDEIVIDYEDVYAYSVPAISLQGKNGGDADRIFDFDDQEYGALPRILGANFVAEGQGRPDADLYLFTLNFKRGYSPYVDCSITGFDAHEAPFSASLQMGCWEKWDLCDELDPEFCYPNLGISYTDSHGWLSLDCQVEWDGVVANGGVHGAIVQKGGPGHKVTPHASSKTLGGGKAAWARLLFQSVTTGDPTRYEIESLGGGGGFQ